MALVRSERHYSEREWNAIARKERTMQYARRKTAAEKRNRRGWIALVYHAFERELVLNAPVLQEFVTEATHSLESIGCQQSHSCVLLLPPWRDLLFTFSSLLGGTFYTTFVHTSRGLLTVGRHLWYGRWYCFCTFTPCIGTTSRTSVRSRTMCCLADWRQGSSTHRAWYFSTRWGHCPIVSMCFYS